MVAEIIFAVSAQGWCADAKRSIVVHDGGGEPVAVQGHARLVP
jgi:hypothetical protein